ncbi:hypothetical protein PAXRUDRAFT_530804 [Paxillus rubicundulus Ve08.2h10]|uniref:Uncharacterized protein n=1 Tax=Paxillus rubicundulus Ve08.2h10 TaxID=930991 RepID=A0A0D0BT69_9AGAM|nr:hypothetical protein PAXRUDRAFT_530804 [Paxillus rubicundulus Ve08.2h10]
MEDGMVGARSTPRKKKRKDGIYHRLRKPRTHAGSSAAETGPSSSNTEGTSSNASPPNPQVGPSTSSDAAPAARTSSYVQSTKGSDDMDCSEKCVDYLCFGPRQNRERFHPWKNQSREVMETEERSKNGKNKKSPRRYSKNEAIDPQHAVHLLSHLGAYCDGIQTVSLASPAADQVDRQHVILHLQQQNEQLRRQLHDLRQKARVDKHQPDKSIEVLSYDHESGKQPERQPPTVSSTANTGSSSYVKLSSFNLHTGAHNHRAGPSISSSPPPTVEEPGTNGQTWENTLNHLTSHATQSQNTLHALHHHDFQTDKVTMGELNLQRAVFQLQLQVEQLCQRFDDPKRKEETGKEELEENIEQLQYSGRESHKFQHPPIHPGAPSAEAGTPSRVDIGPPILQINSDPLQAEERAREKRMDFAVTNSISQATPLQYPVRPQDHHDTPSDNTRAGPTADPAADEADLQHSNFQLQEQVQQLRQQFDDLKQQTDAGRNLLENELEELRSRGHKSSKPKGPHLSTVRFARSLNGDRGLGF